MAAGVAKKRFNKAVNIALGKVNTRIAKLTEHQLAVEALNNFLCGKDSFVCLFAYRPLKIANLSNNI